MGKREKKEDKGEEKFKKTKRGEQRKWDICTKKNLWGKRTNWFIRN